MNYLFPEWQEPCKFVGNTSNFYGSIWSEREQENRQKHIQNDAKNHFEIDETTIQISCSRKRDAENMNNYKKLYSKWSQQLL